MRESKGKRKERKGERKADIQWSLRDLKNERLLFRSLVCSNEPSKDETIMAKIRENKDPTPDRRPLTELQAKRLAALTDVNAKEIVGKNVAEISEKFKWRIDPEFLFFRRICGRVVKKDPVTGIEYPVPSATVHVEDTDCSFLGLFPVEGPWAWFFPLFCHREEIGTAITDACGHFCVYVPRWEVDWILRFRRERICLPHIFLRPTIRELLEGLREPPIIRPPKPEPDPPPFLLRDGGMTLRRAEELVGRDVAGRLAAFEAGAAVGANTGHQFQLLSSKAFAQPLPPPLPSDFKGLGEGAARPDAGAKSLEALRKTLATRLKLDVKRLDKLDFRRFIGPFWRCFDLIVPEWVPILDVPDITFRVTQDVNGDGTEETIYSEGFFDVRWNAGPIPDVTLEASPIAVAGVSCDTPDVPCLDVPAIQFVGRMPLVNPPAPADPYHDAASGYGRRPNRPHPSGNLTDPLPNPLAEAPYTRVLQLYGCNHGGGAVNYRLRYSFNGSALAPFTGLTWPLWRVVGGVLQTLWPAADANGWYPILPDADGWFPPHLLLDWPTGSFPNGLYTVQLELGNAAKAVINTSAAIGFRIDNTAPAAQFTELRWRVTGGVWSPPLELICPVITRPMVGGKPVDIEFRVSYQAMAAHLRSVQLSGGGCGGGNPTLVSALSTAQHWHTTPADNSVANTAIFALPGAMPQGAYSFSLFAASRAFNSAGGDGGQLADWEYDPVYNYVVPTLPVAVVNA
jgi:hypothetical protein